MINRRKWAIWMLSAGGAVGSLVVAVPAMLAALSPIRSRRQGPAWREAGSVDDFEIGQVVPVEISLRRGDWSATLAQKTVYVWRQGEQQFVVYSRNCTDLSCPITFDPGSECFFCPCHGGIFAKDGVPMAGPPNRPLYRYANRLRDGVLEIDLDSLPPFN